MTKKDQEVLAEAYGDIQEGLMDVIRSRGAQAAGAIRGAGSRVKGAAQSAAGGALSKAAELGGQALGVDASEGGLAKKGEEMQKAGAKQTAAGKASAEEAKYKSYITNSAKTIAKDLKGLGMEVGDEAALMQDIQATISKHLTQVTKQGAFNRGGAANRGTTVGVAQPK